MKRAISGFGLVGLVGCFLPLAFGASFFSFHQIAWWPVLVILAAFAVPTVVGLAGTRTSAAIAAASFAYIAYRLGFSDTFDLVIHAEPGGKMMGIAAIGGLIASIGALVESPKSAA